MKILNQIFGAALLALSLAACGSSNTNPYTSYHPYGANYNQMGYNGQAGCQPIQQGTLSFSAQGAQMDSVKILAGNIPSASVSALSFLQVGSAHPGTYGQVTMGGMSGIGGGYTFSPYMGTNGNITQLNAGQNSLSGSIQLSQGAIYNILAMASNMGGMTNTMNGVNGMNGMNTMNGLNSSICVSSVGLWLVHNNNSIYGATVYLYLNNSQTAFSLQL